MSLIVLLDAGPLGLITNPNVSAENIACNSWLESLVARGIAVKIPEIADYEVRRELLRAGKKAGIRQLDDLQNSLEYIPITTQTMLMAAEFWAEIRKQGKPRTDNKALDGDVILAAQATIVANGGYEVIVATTNVSHLSRFISAKKWREIESLVP